MNSIKSGRFQPTTDQRTDTLASNVSPDGGVAKPCGRSQPVEFFFRVQILKSCEQAGSGPALSQ